MNSTRIITLVAALVTIVAATLPGHTAIAAEPGNTPFERTWNRTDLPVSNQQIDRTWMWGPRAFTGPLMEFTTDRPDTGRQVQYFDKSRMELSHDPAVNPYSIWHVTNGLLARELVTGAMQVGDNDFDPRPPAQVNVAGDWDDPTGPTYATFQQLLASPPLGVGTPVTSRLARDGTVTDDPALTDRGVVGASFVPETNHTVASPFWDFMNSSGLVAEDGPVRTGALFPNPYYATGYPISEAYWTNVKVANVYTEVLVQVFERRVLTYTPDNAPGWQVEAGNVGRHYFEWRYGMSTPDLIDNPTGSFAPLGPTPLPADDPDTAAQSTFVIANASPQPLTVTFAGLANTTIDLAGCPDCQVHETPPGDCHTGAARETITLPAGSYAVTVNRPASAVQALTGVWTLLPGSQYGACFFTFR